MIGVTEPPFVCDRCGFVSDTLTGISEHDREHGILVQSGAVRGEFIDCTVLAPVSDRRRTLFCDDRDRRAEGRVRWLWELRVWFQTSLLPLRGRDVAQR